MTARHTRLINVDLEKIRHDGGLSYASKMTTTTVIDVPLLNRRVSPVPTIERSLWEIRHPDGTSRYVTIGNNGELWVVEGIPNPDYAPNIFGLVRGNQPDQFILHAYGMLPNDDDCPYALTVVPEGGEFKLKYSNKNIDVNQWCFLSNHHNDNVALKWCSLDDSGDSGLVLYLDDSDPMHPQLSLTDLSDHSPDNIHFLHIFHTLYTTTYQQACT